MIPEITEDGHGWGTSSHFGPRPQSLNLCVYDDDGAKSFTGYIPDYLKLIPYADDSSYAAYQGSNCSDGTPRSSPARSFCATQYRFPNDSHADYLEILPSPEGAHRDAPDEDDVFPTGHPAERHLITLLEPTHTQSVEDDQTTTPYTPSTLGHTQRYEKRDEDTEVSSKLTHQYILPAVTVQPWTPERETTDPQRFTVGDTAVYTYPPQRANPRTPEETPHPMSEDNNEEEGNVARQLNDAKEHSPARSMSLIYRKHRKSMPLNE